MVRGDRTFHFKGIILTNGLMDNLANRGEIIGRKLTKSYQQNPVHFERDNYLLRCLFKTRVNGK